MLDSPRMALPGARVDFKGTERFEIVRSLGSGGAGVVYEAFDRERGCRVALKVLRSMAPDAQRRFKNEFRALQDIQHPNLVSLGELHEHGGRLFFTMELVRGVDFLVHVGVHEDAESAPSSGAPSGIRGAGRGAIRARAPAAADSPPWRFDEGRLRSAFGQLAQGLVALHAAGKVHRDIKPSNVRITAEGRVVLLDFGLIADVGQGEAEPPSSAEGERRARVVGTEHFMAPEQAAGSAAGPEADWYSMGVVLHLALTGSYPFQVAPRIALDLKQRGEAPPPSALAPGLPEDLASLCADLLRRDPAARPSGAQVLARLGLEEEDVEPPPSSRRLDFVGRLRELAALEEALAEARRGRAVTLLIEGESGVGKSALLRRFLERIPGDAQVLAGRCYERESVPYKAIDEIMEGLARAASRMPPVEVAALLPPDAALLGEVFPALGRVVGHAQRASSPPGPGRASSISSRPEPAREVLDPPAIRARAFAGIREIFRRFSAQRPLVLAIDDLQWADPDGLALLSEVMRPPDAPALLLVATVRTGAEVMTAREERWRERLLLPGEAVRVLDLRPLSAGESRELVEVLARRAALREAGVIEAIAAEAGGHPLLLDALVRHRVARRGDGGPVRLEDMLWAQIERLEAPARRVLELCAVAGRPLPLGIAAHAAAISRADLARVAAELRGASLVRAGGAGHAEFIEPHHDRIRELVVGRLDDEARCAWHGRIALALESSGRADLEELAAHWRAAGDAERAARYAERAGDQAAASLAFDRAASLYRDALELVPAASGELDAPTRSLLTRLGDALSNGGRSAEAAEAFVAAASGAPPGEALELGRRAAENLLRSGYIDEGTAALRAVVEQAGMTMPGAPTRTLASLLLRRARLRLRGLGFEERAAAEVPAEALTRIDVCWSAALGLSLIDPVKGAEFQSRQLLLALQAGEPYRVARALAFEAGYMAASGGQAAARVAELIDAAAAIARRTGHPHALGLVQLVTGAAAMLEGRWRASVEALDRAGAILRERCTGVTWERASAQSFAVWSLWYLGDMRELAYRVPLYLRDAERRGDRYLITNLRSAHSNAYWLALGDPAAAEREAAEAIREWSTSTFHLQDYFDLVARAHIDLYRGEGEGAHRRFVERWPDLRRSMTLRIQAARITMTHLRAAAAVAAARSSPAAPALLREADRTAGALDGERMPWARPLAASVRAAARFARGDAGDAAALLAGAVRDFEAADMPLYAAAARRRCGEIAGGDEGRAAAEAATAWMRAHGVADPDRMTAMLAPGFPD